MSDFLGLRIALSSLQTQRKALDVTGQNVANANTEGYSRQRVSMSSDAGPLTPAIHSTWTGSGMGVSATGVDRFRDHFLELRGHQEHAALSGAEEQRSTLANIETIFAEPSDTAIASQLADFWSGWDDVANRPDDVAARAQLVERANTLAIGFGQADNALTSLSTGTVERLAATVADANVTAGRIADLNKTIRSAVSSGVSPNDLMDQRGLLIRELADSVGATTRPGEDGAVDVFVGGTALVRSGTTEPLAVEAGVTSSRVVWAKDGSPARAAGSVGGMLEAVNVTIPRYQAELGAVFDDVARQVNDVHAEGVALDGSTGRDFFVPRPDGRGWAVHSEIVSDPRMIGAASADAGTRDGSVAQRLAGIADAADSPDSVYRELVVRLGVQAQGINRRVDIQGAITREVDAAQESVAGVNLDEEMTNMITYQHAYDAAARFLTSIDSMLDTLINRTGLVGR